MDHGARISQRARSLHDRPSDGPEADFKHEKLKELLATSDETANLGLRAIPHGFQFTLSLERSTEERLPCLHIPPALWH